MARVRLTGSFEMALPPAEAIVLFTASGERGWAHGWDPEFPSPGADETEPGTVFLTSHGDRPTIWTVAGRGPGMSIRYVATTPGHRAGLISVTCRPTAAGLSAPGPSAAGPSTPGPWAPGPTAPGPTAPGPTAPGPQASGPLAAEPVEAGTPAARTRVTVGYDLTSLTPEAEPELERFAAGYPAFMAHWEQAIARLLRRS